MPTGLKSELHILQGHPGFWHPLPACVCDRCYCVLLRVPGMKKPVTRMGAARPREKDVVAQRFGVMGLGAPFLGEGLSGCRGESG